MTFGEHYLNLLEDKTKITRIVERIEALAEKITEDEKCQLEPLHTEFIARFISKSSHVNTTFLLLDLLAYIYYNEHDIIDKEAKDVDVQEYKKRYGKKTRGFFREN